jgi:hypothetical protein
MVHTTTVGPMFGQCIHFRVFAREAGNDYARSRYTTQAIRVFEAIEPAPYRLSLAERHRIRHRRHRHLALGT